MKIRVQQKDSQIAEIWLGDRYRNLMIWECTSDNINELVIRNKTDGGHEFTHPFDKDGYLLSDQYDSHNRDYGQGGVGNARIYIPPNKVKQ